MKILSVNIENFMAIGKADIALADRGLVLIQGDNQDESSATSNGAGKSSLADAICWCLYGTTARGEEGDRVVNRFTKGGTRVIVAVQDGSSLYDIKRFRKHKVGKNSLVVQITDGAGETTDLTKGTEKLTQELVNQIIGCSYEVFTGAVYAGQERMPDLPGMTDKNLKMLIEEASGATLLEAAYNEAQSRLRTKKSEADVIGGLVERAKAAVNDATDKAVDFAVGEATFESERVEAVKVIHAKGIAVKKEIANQKAKIAGMVSQDELRDRILKLDAQIAASAGERTRETALADDLKKVERTESLLGGEAIRAVNGLKTAESDLAALDHKVGCPCETCARPYAEADIAPAKKLAEDKIRVARAQVMSSSATLESAKRDVLKHAETLKAHRAAMTDISAANAGRIAEVDRLAAVIVEANALKSLEASLKSCVEQITAKRAEINPFIHRIAGAKTAQAFNEKDLQEKEENLAKAADGLRVAEVAAKVFSPAGVRAFLLDEVTPFLNDQTAKYLGTLSDGNITATWTTLIKTGKGELREKFSIEVVNANGGETFKGISGGEKRKVRIACALALQDLVARRATKPIELFIGDEIDDALDPAGIERLTTILEEKARERGSVFIISHSDLKDWIRNTITVTRKGKTATFEEAAA
jgi:DNA repair exonuclease SbcCD ATPase subunit